MSPANAYRLSGMALLIGGGLAALGAFGQGLNDNPLSPIWIPMSLAVAIGLPLLLLGLPAVYAWQMKRAGRLGVVGFTLFFLACVLFGGSSGLSDIVLIPRDLSPGGISGSMLSEDIFFIVMKLLLLISSVVFGIATLRANVFPKGSAILLLVGSVLFIVGGRIHALPLLASLGEFLFFLAFVWFGFALLTSSVQEAEREHVSSSDQAKIRA